MNRIGDASWSFLSAGFTPAMVGAVLLGACENPQAPAMCGAIPEQTLVVGETATVSACFEDANGDLLSYSASSSDPGVATVAIAGNRVTVTAASPGTGTVTITATDATGLTGQLTFRVMVPNRAPVAVGEIESRDLPAGESGSVNVSAYFNEPDGQPLAYAMSVSDESVLAISTAGAVVTFEAHAKGSASVTATATDPDGLSAAQSFVVTVPNRAPGAVGTIEPQIVEVDATSMTDVSGYFTDPDGDELVYTAASSDAGVAEVAMSGGDLTVTAIAKGEATVAVTATDTEGLAATQAFVVTVPNRAPLATGSIEGQTIEVDESTVLELVGYFEDPDGDALVHGATTSDSGVAGVGVDGSVVTVTAVAKGTATVTVTATDTDGLAATQVFQVTVPNRPPLATGSIDGHTIEVGEAATMELSRYFRDPDSDNLDYSTAVSDELLIGASISDGALTVTAVAKGEATVTVTATDPEGLTASQVFTVTVPNRPPHAVGSIDARTFEIGDRVTVDLPGYFEDPDDDELSYSVYSSDATLIGTSVDGTAVTVEALAKGSAVITVTATDTEGLAANQEFAVSVANRPPWAVGSIDMRTVEVDGTVTIELRGYFSDPDGDPLAYTWTTTETSVVSVSVSGGTMTITALQKGLASVSIVATDPEDMTARQEFFVAVSNRAPQAVGTVPQLRINEGGIKRVDPWSRFTDPDGDELVFRAESSNLTVARAWVATNGVVVRGVGGGAVTVTIIAEDPEGATAEQRFGVRVRGSNGGSSSGSNEPPVTVGQIRNQNLEEGDTRMVDASPYFDDPDNDPLEFSARSSNLEVVEATVSGSQVELEVTGTGTATVEVEAKDAGGLRTTQSFGVMVAEAGDGNRAPVLVGTIATRTLEADGTATLDASSYFADPDNDALEFSARSSDIEVVTVSVSGSEIALRATGPGTASVTLVAEDTDGLTEETSFGVTVLEPEGVNRPPIALYMRPLQLKVGNSKTLYAAGRFEDPDGDDLTLSAESSDTGVAKATISGNEIELEALAEGTTTVKLTAVDPQGLSASGEFRVTVTLPGENQPPAVTKTPVSRNLVVDGYVWIQPWRYVDDPDDDYDDLTFSATSSESSVMELGEISPSGLFQAFARSDGEATITVTATDPAGLSASFSVVYTVGNNAPRLYDGQFTFGWPSGIPVVSSPGETDSLTMRTIFQDDDWGDKLRYSVSVSDHDVVKARVLWDGLYGDFLSVTGLSAGEATITATATDLGGLEFEHDIPVTVSNNRPPRVTTEFAEWTSLTEGDTLEFILSGYFDDPDGDDLTYTAASMVQVNHAVSADTLRLTYNQGGIAYVSVTATDPGGREVVQSFFVRVTPASSNSQLSLLIDRPIRAFPCPLSCRGVASPQRHVQVVRRPHVPQRVEPHRPERDLHRAVPPVGAADRAEVQGVDEAALLLEVER